MVSHLVLIPISLLTNEIEPCFICFLAIFLKSLNLLLLSAFFLPICLSALYILHMNSGGMYDKALYPV